MYRITRNLLLLSCMALLIGACAMPSNAQKKPLQVALTTWVGEVPFYVAQQKAFYPSPVTVKTMSSGMDKMRLFAEKGADATTHTMFQILTRIDQGTDIRVIAVLDYLDASDGIIARNDIASVTDLKGKRVAVETKTVSHFVLVSALQQAGLQESDVEIVNLSSQEGINAMQRGTVDAVATWEPLLTRAAQQEDTHKIFTSSEMPYQIMDFLVVHSHVAEQRPQDVVALLDGWEQARQLKLSNEQDFIASAQGMGITEEELQTLVPDLILIDMPTNVAYFQPDNPDLSLKTVYEDTATFMQEHNMLENPIRSYEEVFEPRFVQEYTTEAE